MENETFVEVSNEELIENLYSENISANDSYEAVCVDAYMDDSIGLASTISEKIATVLTIVQMVSIVVAVLCILKGILNIQKNKLIKNVDQNKNKIPGVTLISNNNETPRKKATVGYFIFSAMLLFIYFIINIMKQFAAKPIIYIYPEEEKNIKIKLKNPEKLTCSYPKYEKEWNVLAKPNGDLIDLKTNRKLYALYWEGLNTTKTNFKEGFIVEGENVVEFLEEKLEILGLNEREAEEFIVYWLPLMEKNKYNYIRFETMEEINENMGLEIIPAPETLIRINMEFKGLRKPIQIEEQKLEKVERKGYTVVEWGGTKL